MNGLTDILLSADAGAADLAAAPVPDHYRGAFVRRDEAGMFEGLAFADKDPAKSPHVGEVPTPDVGPGEALIAVMASAINYNTGQDPDIVFEHPGRDTFGASVFVARRGGTIVTCASTTGFQHQYDNRYLWMSLKRVIGSHFANYREAWHANQLIRRGAIHPTLSAVYPLAAVGEATAQVHRNEHAGKVGVLALTPRPGLGVTDPERRERHEAALRRFRTPPPGTARSPGPDPAPAGRAVETGRAPAARLRTPQERT